MTDKPDVKAAVYFDQLQRKVVVEIGVFDDDDDAKAACDFIINLLDLILLYNSLAVKKLKSDTNLIAELKGSVTNTEN